MKTKMKKVTKYLVTAVVAVVLAVGGYFAYDYVTGDSNAQAEKVQTFGSLVSSAEKKDRSKTLVVGLDAEYPPLAFSLADGNIVGFDVEFLKELAGIMDKELVIKPIDWSEKLDRLNSGELDLVASGFTYSKDRTNRYSMSKPYLSADVVVMVPTDSSMSSVDDLGGKVVGLQQGVESHKEILEKFVNSKGQRVAGIEMKHVDLGMALSDMLQGGEDAVLADSPSALYYSKNSPGSFRILTGSFEQDDIVLAAKKGKTELIEDVNRAIDKVTQSRTFRDLHAKWMSDK